MINLKYRRKVLNFFKKKFIKIVKISLTIFMLVVSLYGLFCTVYSDVIVQNENDFWGLPKKSLSEKEIQTTFNELVGKENKTKSLYVFVLDISGSIQKNQMEETAYIKYKDAINMVNNTFAENILKLKTSDQIDIYDIAKARLYELLLALLEKNKDDCNSEFAVWTLGDEGTKIFPGKNKINVHNDSIKAAIKEISKPLGKTARNTNFSSLFVRFTKVYEKELKKKHWRENENPTFFMTILSDLIHDVKNKYDARSREIKANWDELKEKIQEICNSKIMSNMIVFSEKEPDIQRSIFSLFKDNIDWYRLNKYLVGEEKNNSFLYTVRTTENDIKFYYENPNYISNSTFTLRYTGIEMNTIKIDIPLESDNDITQKISVFCEKLGAKDDPMKGSKRIISGGSEYTAVLEKNQKIRLTFNGRLPSALSSPILRISLCNEGRIYLISIDFVKRLPNWASVFFIILQIIFWIVISSLVVGLLIFLFLKFFVKDKIPGEAEENRIEGISSPGQDSFEKSEVYVSATNISQADPIKETTSITNQNSLEKNESPLSALDTISSIQIGESDLININTASLHQLKTLPGINAKRARQIKTIRENHPFKSIDELKGALGKDVFRKIKDNVCV